MMARRIGLALLAVALLAVGCGDEADEGAPERDFAPQASLRAIGGTERTDKPAVLLRVETRPGDAGIRSAAVLLPAAFLVDQTALANLCGERELEAKRCAGRKRLGVARVLSPIYDEPLEGPVFPVSGSGGLPRLAYVLGGPAEFLLRGRIEVRGARIEATVDDVPDAPVNAFELRIDGGAPGYLVLSRDICRTPATADVRFSGEQGTTHEEQVPLAADCAGEGQ